MSINKLINNGLGLPVEPWKNLKVNDIEATNIEIVNDLTVGNLTADGNATFESNLSVWGDATVDSNVTIEGNLSIGNIAGYPIDQYISIEIENLQLFQNVGGIDTLIDSNYNVKITRLGDLVTLRLNKFIEASANNVEYFTILQIPPQYLAAVNSVDSIVLKVSNNPQMCRISVHTDGLIYLARFSGDFGIGDGFGTAGTTGGTRSISYNIN